MTSNKAILRRDEEYVLELRRLYESFGYKKFKMSKFEQYELYSENKSFLKNGNIITVSDPKGRLLALKPDITLSIVKNLRASTLPEKLYYSESVYFSDNEAGEIKETTQVGLEYIGDLDIRALAEILILSAESLDGVDEDYRIAISHMSFLSDILDSASVSESGREKISKAISQKNLHGLLDLCSKYSISEDTTKRLSGLISICGRFDATVSKTADIVCGELSQAAFDELTALSEILSSFGLSDKFILDFSVMNDMNYYNGLVFQGFVNGVPKSVLSGGRYDNLVHRFGCDASAAGFAVSIDLLNEFHYRKSEFDYDVFLAYSPVCSPSDVLKIQQEFSLRGEKCIALSNEPSGLKYRRKVVVLSDGSVKDE